MANREKLGGKASVALRGPLAPLRTSLRLTPGRAVRIYREAQGLTQAALAKLAGLTQATVSSIESGRATLGIERAKKIARALKLHPAAIAFPDWDMESAA